MTLDDDTIVCIERESDHTSDSDAMMRLYHNPSYLPSQRGMVTTTVDSLSDEYRACSRCFPEIAATEQTDRLEAIYRMAQDRQPTTQQTMTMTIGETQ